ncbi:MAG: cache domain-containing protein [Spirochaetales bacterium]|nr:cache domain-containing protein [Spirochaetales bacterium]
MFSSIQGKNTFYIISILFFFLTILLFFNYILLRDFSLDNAQRTSKLILESADSQLDIIFDEIEAIVGSMSTLRAVREVDVEDMSELFISNVFVRNKNVRAIYLGTSDGRMFEWGMGEGFTDNMPEFPEDYDPRIRPWYRLAAETQDYGLTSPYVYASIEALGITAAKPVYNKGNLVGVIGLDLILYGLENVVNSLKVPMGGRIILLDQSGEILVNQFTPTSKKITELEMFSYPEYQSYIDGFVIDDIFGDRYMITNRVNRMTGWSMLLFIPYGEIMKFSHQTILYIIFMDLILIFLMGILITFFTRYLVTAPLEDIISTLSRYEQGDLSARIQPLKIKEFNLMARLFNRLTDISEESSQKLEEKVDKRTKAIIKLQKENVRLRIIEEKERLYGDLHDSLGARLTSINISNHVARNAFEIGDSEVLTETFERIEKNTMMGIEDLNQILKAGKEDMKPRQELNLYVEKDIRERLELKDIKLSADLPGSEELSLLDSELLYNLERIIQEMVSNTMKHSNASKVKVSMKIESQKVSFIYKDNGKGFILKEAMKNGFGLQGLMNRAERNGGILKIQTKEGQGAKFEFHFRINQT